TEGTETTTEVYSSISTIEDDGTVVSEGITSAKYTTESTPLSSSSGTGTKEPITATATEVTTAERIQASTTSEQIESSTSTETTSAITASGVPSVTAINKKEIEGKIVPPTDQEVSYEGNARTGTVGPPGTAPASESELTGSDSRKPTGDLSSEASSTVPSVIPSTETPHKGEQTSKVVEDKFKGSTTLRKGGIVHVEGEKLSGGKKIVSETEEVEHHEEISSSGVEVEKTGEKSSGGRTIVIKTGGVEHHEKVLSSGAEGKKTSVEGGSATRVSKTNVTDRVEEEGERNVVKISFEKPKTKSLGEGGGESMMNAKIHERLHSEKGVAKTNGQVESGTGGQETQIGISIGKVPGEKNGSTAGIKGSDKVFASGTEKESGGVVDIESSGYESGIQSSESTKIAISESETLKVGSDKFTESDKIRFSESEIDTSGGYSGAASEESDKKTAIESEKTRTEGHGSEKTEGSGKTIIGGTGSRVTSDHEETKTAKSGQIQSISGGSEKVNIGEFERTETAETGIIKTSESEKVDAGELGGWKSEESNTRKSNGSKKTEVGGLESVKAKESDKHRTSTSGKSTSSGYEFVEGGSKLTQVVSSSSESYSTKGRLLSPSYQTHFIQRCTANDDSPCHDYAECDIESGLCACKAGYYGDGYSTCTRIDQDCILDPDICDTTAVCNLTTHRCRCIHGFIGDGLTCVPDVQDCVLRPNLCSDFASCIQRRCVCDEGYTGDGTSCVSLEPIRGCSRCDIRADCINGTCECAKTYFGNGETCIPDPSDCVHYPGLCRRNSNCDEDSRRCKCLQGFLGDGSNCVYQKNCTDDRKICDGDAECLPSGVCQCKRGFTGNGISCHAAVLINADEVMKQPKDHPMDECGRGCDENEKCASGKCECEDGYERNEAGQCIVLSNRFIRIADADECSVPNGCHPVAICTNLPGSYVCDCPDGYKGDGYSCVQYHYVNNMTGIFMFSYSNFRHDEEHFDCGYDGIELILSKDSDLFDGRIFVRGQTENPYCSKRLNAVAHNESDYRFLIPFGHCNVRFEIPDTFSVTVVIQRHPAFITQTADAYDLRCTYPVGSRQVMSHVNVSEMTTADTIVKTGVGPICHLKVTNNENELIDTATVGQVLRLTLSVQPNDTYSILPRNCFAINLETGERYSLTDQAGCAIDTQLFPEWLHKQPSITTATFRTFKWPDSSMIRFQCDCSACIGTCPKINCERRREAMRRRRMRLRYIRGTTSEEELLDELDDQLRTSLVASKHQMTFSDAVHVDEDEEERRAQREVDNWKYQGLVSMEPVGNNLFESQICVRALWVGISLLPLMLAIALLGVLSILWKRRSSSRVSQKADFNEQAISTNNQMLDNSSSYIKF
ncbi:unnamed protein product, partial [Anisakis simplex]|uniref:FBN-1A.1 (inferred by orthology to a C. elegans protein) n=1 Tax=Anisakis simplex TaxID=6269 RepID=A0A0M3K6K1_ANISI